MERNPEKWERKIVIRVMGGGEILGGERGKNPGRGREETLGGEMEKFWEERRGEILRGEKGRTPVWGGRKTLEVERGCNAQM